MKWETIRLLCEYSDDFSLDEFKDICDELGDINEEHFDQLSPLQQEFVTFLDQYDKLETDIFTDGYNDELKIYDNISPHTREEYKLDNNVKYYGVYFFTYLHDLLMQIYDHRDLFSKMSSKMKQHIHDIFDMYEKLKADRVTDVNKTSSGTVWYKDKSYIALMNDMMQKLVEIDHVDLEDHVELFDEQQLSKLKVVYQNIANNLRTKTHLTVQIPGKYDKEIQRSDSKPFKLHTDTILGDAFLRPHWIHEFDQYGKDDKWEKSVEFNGIRYKLYQELEKLIPMYRYSRFEEDNEGEGPFDVNNPPEVMIQRIHAVEELIVQMAEFLDFI